MENCWCGCSDLKKYSKFYNVCPNCHTLVSTVDFTKDIYKIKDEENDLYGKSYWEKHMVELSGLKDMDEIIDSYLKERAIYWLKYLLKYKLPNASIAEIGCGLGQFSYLLKVCQYKQTSFELSPEICDYVRKTLKINILNNELVSGIEDYDVVVALDLLEHIIDVHDFMKNISKVLKSNGILCFQTPCYDSKLSYKEMLKQKPNFQKLMVQNEHVYLLSRKSIEKLLKSYGFNYINFEPAFFGDDYDMFVFASRNPMKEYSNDEINGVLNIIDNGRMIKALIALFNEKNILTKNLNNTKAEAKKRLENLDIITKQLETVKKDSQLRLEDINILTSQLQISEKDRADRLEVINNQSECINNLQKQEKEKDAVIGSLQNDISLADNNYYNLQAEFDKNKEECGKLNMEYIKLNNEMEQLKQEYQILLNKSPMSRLIRRLFKKL